MTTSATLPTTAAVPGQILGSLSSHIPGAGTHVYENSIRASITGFTLITPAVTKSSKPTVSISRNVIEQRKNNPLPSVGSIILARILRVQQRQLTASILVVDPEPSSIVPYAATTNDDLQFQATLRKEDVRAYEKDKVVMNEMFRVGDIIKATVISLGDERNYYISTAGNEYGVVVAKSDAGNAMVPASWKEMRDVITGKGESRKVAKPS